MRNYEVAVIANPDLDEQAIQALEGKISSWITAAEGKALDVQRWGRRRLAYPIEGNTDGFYFFIQTEMPSQAGVSIERELQLNEDVLRFMITRTDEG